MTSKWFPGSRVYFTGRALRRSPAILTSLGLLALLGLDAAAQGRSTGQQADPIPFTFAAVGDAGEPGRILGMVAHSVSARTRPDHGEPVQLLLFLGDNFYPTGLNVGADDVSPTIRACLGPFAPALAFLGQSNVHAIPGNHDYYCGMLGPIPHGRCIQGNSREAAITAWTFHMIAPAAIRRPLHIGSRDSIEFIFFDSALLLATHRSAWRSCLDSLEHLLRASASNPRIRWRIIVTHHSPISVGEHAGWRRWSDSEKRVRYVGNCLADGMDPMKYVEEAFSAQDNCAEPYRAYADSLDARIVRSGVPVQMILAGHEHSLQLLAFMRTQTATAARTYIISGAGSKTGKVRSPLPPHVWTHPDTACEGNSAPGYLLGSFVGDHLEVRFIDARTNEPLDMGGRAVFRIGTTGKLE